jgi:hypothetical protein
MALVIFILSVITATLCSALLFRAYFRKGVRLLFWAGICFAALSLEAVVLIINEYTTTDLTIPRLIVPLLGMAALLYGLLWESEPH